MTIREFSERNHISERTTFREIAAGHLHPTRLKRRKTLIHLREEDRWRKERTDGPLIGEESNENGADAR